MMMPARAMNMTVSQFFLGGFPNAKHFNSKV
jgi:hypothetical protein